MDQNAAQYEFTPAQNEILGRAARWTGLFAWIMIVGSVLMALAAIFSGEGTSIVALIMAAVYFLIGLTFRGAAVSMNQVVRTEGNDMDHLMTAVDKLGSAFKIVGIVFLLGVVLTAVATVAIWAWMSSVSA